MYKNFRIIHDGTPNISNVSSISIATSQVTTQMTLPFEMANEKIVMSNPSIAPLLTASSQQIDKVNKMLEEHRKKKTLQQFNNPLNSGEELSPNDLWNSNPEVRSRPLHSAEGKIFV